VAELLRQGTGRRADGGQLSRRYARAGGRHQHALVFALRYVSPRRSTLGSAMAVMLFLGTLSLLFTTPGITASGGFPVLSALPGQALIKDIVYLGAALWTLGDSLGAAKPAHSHPAGPPRSPARAR